MPRIIYSDEEIVVVSKPAGMCVHPSPGHEKGALSDFLVRRFPEMASVGSPERPGVVHRLDAETSGVMVFARTRRAYVALRRAFESHRDVKKTYLAVLHGTPKPREGVLETTIGRKPWDPRRFAVNVPGGKFARTRWRVLAKKGALALVEFEIDTGRTHQIRLHAAHLGCPVVGDALYGRGDRDRSIAVPPSHHLLHAVSLAFPHPASRQTAAFSAPPPPELVFATTR